jgi:hypothetical protein
MRAVASTQLDIQVEARTEREKEREREGGLKICAPTGYSRASRLDLRSTVSMDARDSPSQLRAPSFLARLLLSKHA